MWDMWKGALRELPRLTDFGIMLVKAQSLKLNSEAASPL